MDAAAWLSRERRLIEHNDWTPPAERGARGPSGPTVAEYAADWLASKPMAPRTKDSYEYLLGSRLTGTPLAGRTVRAVTVADIRAWFGALDSTTPTAKSRSYQCLSSMFSAAVEDGLLTVNPCRIRGASTVRRARPVVHLGAHEVDTLVSKMPERLQAFVALGAWCGLRFGEIVALTRSDLAEDGSVVSINKAYTRRRRREEIGPPKTKGSVRWVNVPPHVVPVLVAHLVEHVGPGGRAPLFTNPDGSRLTEGGFRKHWQAARAAIGRPGLRFHDLRHFAGLEAAYAHATVAESMSRLGHSNPRMALHYTEVAAGRDAELAKRISARHADT
jgi:integrase